MSWKFPLFWAVAGCLGLIAGTVSFLRVLQPDKPRLEMNGCASNMRQLGLALIEYEQDNDLALPSVVGATAHSTWKTAIMPYLQNPYVNALPLFSGPSRTSVQTGSDGLPMSYAANTSGAGRRTQSRGPFAPPSARVTITTDNSSALTIALCEVQNSSSPGFDIDNPFFGPSVQKLYAGHHGRSNYLFLDGHAQALRPLQTVGRNAATVADATNLWYLDNSKLSSTGMQTLATTERGFRP